MRLLLDTHALIWWAAGDAALSVAARDAIADESNDVFVSAASAWEIAAKHRKGKLPGAGPLAADIVAAIARYGFIELPISAGDGQAAGKLPGLHGDPFDRMLIAQSLAGQLVIVSNERVFDRYGVSRLW